LITPSEIPESLGWFLGYFIAGTYVVFVSSGLLSGLACCALVYVIWLNFGACFVVLLLLFQLCCWLYFTVLGIPRCCLVVLCRVAFPLRVMLICDALVVVVSIGRLVSFL
jgi:hypothetical protein